MDTPVSKATQAAAVPYGQHSRINMLSITLLIATLWLTTRPYVGVIDDSKFYTVQALNALMPGRFTEDLYFRYGSQDQFTIFSFIYAPFLGAFGIAKGNFILTVLGEFLWVASLFCFARSMFSDEKMALIAVVAAIVLPGNLDLLRSGEPILTPRLFAESFTLYAMGAMLRGHPLRSLVILCLSVIIHPLMTLPGLAVLFFYEAIKRPALWLAGAGATIAVLVFAISGVQPFSRLLLNFDPAWLAIVRLRDYFCFITQWGIGIWLPVCNTFAIAALGLSLAKPNERRFLFAVLVVSIGGFAVSLVGGDFLHNVLIVDTQTWRAAWLLAVVAHLFVGPALLRIKKHGQSTFTNAVFLVVFALCLLALSGFIPQLCVVSAPMAVIAWLVTAWEHQRQHKIPTIIQFLVFLCVGLISAITIIFVYLAMVQLAQTPIAFLQTARGITLTFFALIALLFYLTSSTRVHKLIIRPYPMLFIAVTLVALAGFSWDQRSPWTKFVDTTATPPVALTSLLPGNSPIYWEGDVTVPWFVLKRASYFSCDQGTGVLFSRGTAINYQRRYNNFQPLRTLDFGGVSWCPSAEGHVTTPLNKADLSTVCKNDQGLGALVLTKPAEDDPGELWVSPVKFEDDRTVDGKLRIFKTDRFFIYSCTDLR